MYIDLITLIYAINYILPAYIANALPMILSGRTPIDFGIRFPDGRPIFGDHKTIRGLLVGLAAGFITAFLQNSLIIGGALTIGALLGDLGGAFIKRRLAFLPGQPFPILDQLDFIVGALLVVSLISIPDIGMVFSIVLITPIVHMFTNAFAYLLRIKDMPW